VALVIDVVFNVCFHIIIGFKVIKRCA
jgi:hypothetical protein